MQPLKRTLHFYLDSDSNFTNEETYFIKRLNEALENFDQIHNELYTNENILFDIEYTRDLFDYHIKNYNYSHFEFLSQFNAPLPFININNPILVHNSPEIINMNQTDFEHFIIDKKIDTVFLNTTYHHLDEFLLKEDIVDLYDDEDTRITKNILINYIKTYNNIFKKIDKNSLEIHTYFCLFNGFAFGCTIESYSFYINRDFILSLLVIMAKTEIEIAIQSLIQKREQEELEQSNQLKATMEKRSQELKINLEKLSQNILNDPIFKTCSSEKDRLRYLRTILKNESYDVINHLEMEILSTGAIRAKGIQGKLFINQLWENCKKNNF